MLTIVESCRIIYIPHVMSDYYHDDIYDYSVNDIITIMVAFDIPVILWGDFNSRTGVPYLVNK